MISSSFPRVSRSRWGSTAQEFRLEPLGSQHNAADDAHGRPASATSRRRRDSPGRAGQHQMSLAENLHDLERHAQDFAERRGFTYTVLSTGTGEVIGCVYIYPRRGESQRGASAGEHDATVRSWVRVDCAELDPVALPHGPRMAGTRLAVPLDRVRATGLTWCRRAGPRHGHDRAPLARLGPARRAASEMMNCTANTLKSCRSKMPSPTWERRAPSMRWRSMARSLPVGGTELPVLAWSGGGSWR